MEISVSIILILCDIKINFHWEILNIAFTVLWVVGLINAFNIIDIMDGLCAGVARVASLHFYTWCPKREII